MKARRGSALKCLEVLAYAAATWLCASPAVAATIQVGPTRTYKSVQAGYNAASSGDTIDVDSGTYSGAAGWVYVSGKSNVTFHGMGTTRPVLDAGSTCLNGKGIFVIELGTSNITIDNFELRNTRIYNGAGSNAAGIRGQGSGLTVRNCYIHDNDDGMLTNVYGDVTVEFTEFNHNGEGDGQSHNMYIGNCNSFTLRYCWSHNAVVGHQVKTRAQVNYVLYNLISDDSGSGSLEVDIPQAGTSYVIGNLIYQDGTGNSTIISYSEESSANTDKHLYVASNTIYSPIGGVFVYNASATTALVMNNIFLGGSTVSGPVSQVTNCTSNVTLVNPGNYDYHLMGSSSGAINKGTAPGTSGTPATGVSGFSLAPVSQYVAPCNCEARLSNGALDIGAYEYVNRPPTVDAGPDIDVYEGQPVHLHATASDPDADPLMYAWAQISGPSITLSGGTTADASFTAPSLTSASLQTITFFITVRDGKGGTANDAVNVHVWMVGDTNRDDSVDVVDLLNLVAAFGSVNGDVNYDPTCDLNNDGSVDVVDLLNMVDNFGRTLQ